MLIPTQIPKIAQQCPKSLKMTPKNKTIKGLSVQKKTFPMPAQPPKIALQILKRLKMTPLKIKKNKKAIRKSSNRKLSVQMSKTANKIRTLVL